MREQPCLPSRRPLKPDFSSSTKSGMEVSTAFVILCIAISDLRRFLIFFYIITCQFVVSYPELLYVIWAAMEIF